MSNRREFFKSAAALGVLGTAGLPLRAAETGPPPATAGADRAYWAGVAQRIARPVLENLSRRELKQTMPVEQRPNARREAFTHLEAFGRTLCGIAPWLGLDGLGGPERASQLDCIRLAQQSLDAATDPASADFLNFSAGGQALVDTAFLAQGILRAPRVLWEPLDARTKQQVIAALKSSRGIGTPRHNNWVMFAATVEALLLAVGEPTLRERLEDCTARMLNWYCGDGAYGDGEFFRHDYYNSFVIHPMLLDVLAQLHRHDERFGAALRIELRRAQRFAAVQERLIAPDGSFPAVGRSITYRFGALQTLAHIAWLKQLPEHPRPAQVRGAMTAVIRRIVEAPGTFDAGGWLQIGFCGHQPQLAEAYISTGSLYLCMAGLLPLGLPPEDEFWSAPAAAWTSQQIWSGQDLPADHALEDARRITLPVLQRSGDLR